MLNALLAGAALLLTAPSPPVFTDPVNPVVLDASWVARYGEAPSWEAPHDERVRTHLLWVSALLADTDASHLDTVRRERRDELVAALAEYARAAVYPRNDKDVDRRPFFIDDHGRHCAVGHLIAVSGDPWLAEEVNASYPLAYVAEMDVPEVVAWADAHGLAADELSVIQPAYSPEWFHPREHTSSSMGVNIGGTFVGASTYDGPSDGGGKVDLSSGAAPAFSLGGHWLWNASHRVALGGRIWFHHDHEDHAPGTAPAIETNLMLQVAFPFMASRPYHDLILFTEVGGTFLIDSPGEYKGVNYGGGIGGIFGVPGWGGHWTLRADLRAQGYSMWDGTGAGAQVDGVRLLASIGFDWNW